MQSDLRARSVRTIELAVAAASIAAAVASVVWLRPSAAFAGIVALLAIGWGSAQFAIRTFLARPASAVPDRSAPASRAGASVTTIVCVGAEPPDLARATIVLAARAGPTSVVTTADAPDLDDLAPPSVAVFAVETMAEGLAAAIAAVRTDATFITSASAFPVEGARDAATRLGDDVGWVIGRVDPLATDAFGPSERGGHEARQRRRARRGGLTIWEPDATIVRTDLLAGMPVEPGRPRGDWLRELAARGLVGAETSTVVAVHAAPSDGPLFWPSDVMGTRGLTADLARAARRGPVRSRALAVSELLGQLSAYQLALWLVFPVLVANSVAFPFRIGAPAFVALHGGLAAARWAAPRLAMGTGLRPRRDALAAIYQVPASVLALPALDGHIRRLRVSFPGQPLLLAAVVASVALAIPLLDRPATADSGIDGTIGLAVIALAAVWACAVHAIGPRAWTRSTYRLRVDAPAELDGVVGRLRDGSPAGAAVFGPFDHVRVGDRPTLSVALPDGTSVAVPATVVDRHGKDDQIALGLSLTLDASRRAAWVGGLIDANAHLDDRSAVGARRGRGRSTQVELSAHQGTKRLVRRLEAGAVAVVSVALVTAVALSVVGYRMLVIRSGSMVPTLEVGDITVVDWTRAADLHIGDIITFPSPELDEPSVTHRIRTIGPDRSDIEIEIEIETRGDANVASEYWTAEPDELLGRQVARVPAIGGWVARVGRLRAVLAGLALALVLVAVVAARSARRGEALSPPPAPARLG